MKVLFVLFIFLTVGLITGVVGLTHSAPVQASIPSSLTEEKDLLRATVAIEILSPYVDSQGQVVTVQENGRETVLNAMSTGLGTLVNVGSDTYLITHDHYSQLDAAVGEVIITGYAGFRLTMPVQEFRGLIRYRNNSTLVLETPGGLHGHPTAAGNGDEVSPGSVVQIIYRHPETKELAVKQAEVEYQLDFQGIPSLQLNNLSGEPIRKGNSGGGVWYQGRLIGNIHRTIIASGPGDSPDKPEGAPSPTHRSYATRLSSERMALLGSTR
jgi:hypothetical protein